MLVVGDCADNPRVDWVQPSRVLHFGVPYVGEKGASDGLELALNVEHDLSRAVKFVLVDLVVAVEDAVDLCGSDETDKLDPIGIEKTPGGLFEPAGFRRVHTEDMSLVVVIHLGHGVEDDSLEFDQIRFLAEFRKTVQNSLPPHVLGDDFAVVVTINGIVADGELAVVFPEPLEGAAKVKVTVDDPNARKLE